MAPPVKKKRLVSAYAALIGAAVVLYLAAWSFSDARGKLEDCSRCTGVVVGMETKRLYAEQRNNLRRYPRFRFTTTEGQAVTVLSRMDFRRSSLSVGDEVEVLYPPEKPEEAEIYTPWVLFRWSIVLAIVGGAQVLIGSALLFLSHPVTRERVREWLR